MTHTDQSTPWGQAQSAQQYAEGITFYSTAGHGGFHLSEQRNALVPDAYRIADGWYEEDCEWAKVAVTFPHLFTACELKCADQTLRDYFPDAYEAVTGSVLQPGRSRTKDERRFRRDHANDWVVIAAITATREPGFVECIAVRGGDRTSRDQRRFLVPAQEYEPGRFGFVIDEERYRLYDAPSHFAGWD